MCVKLGRRIRLLRTERGMTQVQLADLAAPLSRVNLYRIEAGKAEPGCRTMTRIAHALGIKLRDLVDGLD